MEPTRVANAVFFSQRGIESATGDLIYGETSSSRRVRNSASENVPPDAGKTPGTFSSRSSEEAFIRHTATDSSFLPRRTGTTTKDKEGRAALSENHSNDNAAGIAAEEGREDQGSDFREPSVFSSQGIEMQRLVQTDRRVRSHEHAHIAAGGQYVLSGASYSYQRGPNGKLYAVGGEVNIDTSEIPGDPEATMRKMQQIRSAALAPSDPSSQDRAVAAKASQIEARARQESFYLKMEEREANFSEGPAGEGRKNRSELDLFV